MAFFLIGDSLRAMQRKSNVREDKYKDAKLKKNISHTMHHLDVSDENDKQYRSSTNQKCDMR